MHYEYVRLQCFSTLWPIHLLRRYLDLLGDLSKSQSFNFGFYNFMRGKHDSSGLFRNKITIKIECWIINLTAGAEGWGEKRMRLRWVCMWWDSIHPGDIPSLSDSNGICINTTSKDMTLRAPTRLSFLGLSTQEVYKRD